MVSQYLYTISYYGPRKGRFDNTSLSIVPLGLDQTRDPNLPPIGLLILNLYMHELLHCMEKHKKCLLYVRVWSVDQRGLEAKTTLAGRGAGRN
jgi:hypothetical protein